MQPGEKSAVVFLVPAVLWAVLEPWLSPVLLVELSSAAILVAELCSAAMVVAVVVAELYAELSAVLSAAMVVACAGQQQRWRRFLQRCCGGNPGLGSTALLSLMCISVKQL